MLYIFWFLHQTTTVDNLNLVHHMLYIFWFLHQTTTVSLLCRTRLCCISFDSYIKPQLLLLLLLLSVRCISFDSYIKPQLYKEHKTATKGCISFDSYIKPQLLSLLFNVCWVVYLLIPTSNHNGQYTLAGEVCVVYLLIPTSNHNGCGVSSTMRWLYIFWFLHQTTTTCDVGWTLVRCISFDSYIKPQPGLNPYLANIVVYLLIPTSNHNLASYCNIFFVLYIFWFLHQTTTITFCTTLIGSCISFDSYIKPQPIRPFSVYGLRCISFDSYIKPQQVELNKANTNSCISFDSYIKPQLKNTTKIPSDVVYLLIPTSNHNQP